MVQSLPTIKNMPDLENDMKKKFEDHKFLKKSIVKIDRVNSIIDEYRGKSLTLRQVFYQLVADNYHEVVAYLRNA